MSFLNCQRGNVAIIFALTLCPLLVVVGSAVDYSRLATERSEIQASMDAIALAGARVHMDLHDEDEAAVKRGITDVVSGLLDDLDGTLSSEMSLSHGFSVDMEAKTVTVSGDFEITTTILGLVHIEKMQAAVSSTAMADPQSEPVCILALGRESSDGISFEGDGELKAKQCVVWSNVDGPQSMRFDGRGKVEAERLCAVGRAGSRGQFKVEPEPENDCNPIDDPLEDWVPPAVGACTEEGGAWKQQTTVHLSPGTYCGGLRVDAKNIMMSPGIYIVKDGPFILRGKSKIKGSGIGVYLTGAGSYLDIDGKTKVEILSAEQGPMAGIVFAADRVTVGAGYSVITGRSDLKIGGVVYLPRHRLEYWGESNTRAASPVTTIIADAIRIGGDAVLEVKNDKKKARFAPVISTGEGRIYLVN